MDTRRPVAREALAVGASVVNDVAAADPDPVMDTVLAETGAGYVGMHAGAPRKPCKATPAMAMSSMGGDFGTPVDRPGSDSEFPARWLWTRESVSEKRLITLWICSAGCRNLQRRTVRSSSGCHESPSWALVGSGCCRPAAGALPAPCGRRCKGVQVFRTHDVAATVQAAG